MILETSNLRPDPDSLLVEIADYVLAEPKFSAEAYDNARYALLDSLGCALLALNYSACAQRLGPVVAGTIVPRGARVPGTSHEIDPAEAAFNIGCAIRWLDFNDTWLAAEWGHPSDNLAAILAVADFTSRATGKARVNIGQVLTAMIEAYEIQGILALANSFNRVGLDHVLLVRVASAAVATRLLGGGREQIINALSNAWADGAALRAYRQAPNTGPRKSWAAGDAAARGVRHALMALRGEMGYPSILSAKQWGFCDALFGGQPIRMERALGCYVMENVLFKISFPAEFHAQTAVEAAVKLSPQTRHRLEEIQRIELTTHQSAMRIIDKRGPLHNPADRDHCLQYMAAVALLFGNVAAEHYEEETAANPQIDALRGRMTVREDERYSRDYLDPEKRSIANAVQVFFKNGAATEKVQIEYPIGHRRRRGEAIPLLVQKAKTNLLTRLKPDRVESILELFGDAARLRAMPADAFIEQFPPTG